MSREQFINHFTYQFRGCKYLEFILGTGENISKVSSFKKVGIDPLPQLSFESIFEIYIMNPEKFFQLNMDLFNVIFLTKIQLSYTAQKYFINALKCIKEGGYIILDDIYPQSEDEQMTEKNLCESDVWTGDIWKFVYFLLKNLDFKIFQIYRSDTDYLLDKNFRGCLAIKINEDITKNIKLFHNFRSMDYNFQDDYHSYLELLENIPSL